VETGRIGVAVEGESGNLLLSSIMPLTNEKVRNSSSAEDAKLMSFDLNEN
jgi:hypothetical protein